MRAFRNDYAVFLCDHVFQRADPVTLVVRDSDGDWQFLCGVDGCVESSTCHTVGVGHLIGQDSTLASAAQLEPGQFLERASPNQPWVLGTLEDEG